MSTSTEGVELCKDFVYWLISPTVKVMQRGEHLDNMNDRADQLLLGSSQFAQQSTRLRRKMLIQNLKGWAILILIAAGFLSILIYFIVDHNNPGHGFDCFFFFFLFLIFRNLFRKVTVTEQKK